MLKTQLLELFPLGNPFPLDGDRRRYDPVTAIAGGVGLVGNLVGGVMGKGAATKAGQIQQQAADVAAGKVGQATGEANRGIADATHGAQDTATGVSNRYIDTAGAAANGVTGAAHEANGLLDPYATTGNTATTALNAGLAAGGDFNKTPTMADITIDPGYAFRQQQAEQALARSAAARGGAVSGAALKDLNDYVQGSASQEYQNAFQRFQTSTQNRFGNLMTASNAGQAAAGTQGGNLTTGAARAGDFNMQGAAGSAQANEFGASAGMAGAGEIGANLMNGAKTEADLTTGGAAAKAAGVVGGSNALTAGIAGASNAVTNAATLNLLKNPATSSRAVVNPNTGGYYSGTAVNPDGSLTVRR